MKMIFLPTSSNKKTGDIMQSYSCETVEGVKHAKALGINAVIASVDPKEPEKELKAVGLYGAQCPAQVKEGMDCNR